MKGSETFKKVIKAYLDKRAAEDELFAKDYAKPGKNIDDCCDFIISEVKKSGRNGFDDDEIYGMAGSQVLPGKSEVPVPQDG